jgi:hypothetical protein
MLSNKYSINYLLFIGNAHQASCNPSFNRGRTPSPDPVFDLEGANKGKIPKKYLNAINTGRKLNRAIWNRETESYGATPSENFKWTSGITDRFV